MEFPDRKITVIWDQAPYHRALSVKMAAATLDIAIEPLPSYSPDFMPVEHLWRWLREDVTYHTCYPTKQKLIQQVNQFVDNINLDPFSISDRLWAQNHLEPEEEKLRVST